MVYSLHDLGIVLVICPQGLYNVVKRAVHLRTKDILPALKQEIK